MLQHPQQPRTITRGRGRGRGGPSTNNRNFQRNTGGQIPQNQRNAQHDANNSRGNKVWERNAPKDEPPNFDQGNNQSSSNANFSSHQSTLNGNAVTAADRAKRFGTTSKGALYDELKHNRILERKQAIEDNLIADPNIPRRLEDAIEFRGTCQTMCPEFELVEREYQNGLDSIEMDEYGHADPYKTVKAYRRSAAGNDQPLPSDVRPPPVLKETLDYLVDNVLSEYPLVKCHAFLRDRTRSIRQDFTLQNIRDITAVQVHERIARFHILCLHEMCELEEEKFSEQQETEQLRKVLLSLTEFYDDLRDEGIETPNEAEFRAYYIITHLRDNDITRQAMALPPHIFLNFHVKRALQFYGLAQRNNEIQESSSRRNKPANIEACQNFYSKFFKLVAAPDTPFLMSCLLEWHFPEVRKGALKAMNKVYMKLHPGVEAEYVRQVLAYDTMKQLIEEVELYGLQVDMSLGQPTILFGQKYHGNSKAFFFAEPLSTPRPRRSMMLVEPKKSGISFREIVNGTSSMENGSVIQAQQQNNQLERARSIAAINQAKRAAMEAQIAQAQLKLHQEKQAYAKAIAHAENQARLQAELQAKEKAAQEKEAEIQRAIEEQRRQEELKATLEEEARIAEESRRREEEEMTMRAALAAEEERRRAEKAAAEAAEQERLRQEEQERAIARMHRQALISQLSNRWMNELVKTVIRQASFELTTKAIQRVKKLQKKLKPWIKRARTRVEKRDEVAKARNKRWHFNMYKAGVKPWEAGNANSTGRVNILLETNIVSRKAQETMKAEETALAKTTWPEDGLNEAIWKTENFAERIYPIIKTPMRDFEPKREDTSAKSEWQLWIHLASRQEQSAEWIQKKFGLDKEFYRRIERYKEFNITTRSVTPDDLVYRKAVNELGAVLFSLSEMKISGIDDCENVHYWAQERKRLHDFLELLCRYNPGIQVPIVFGYWPTTATLEKALNNIPRNLGILNTSVISDFKIMIMSPMTIVDRLEEDVEWLAKNMVINQPMIPTL
ncbi:SAC3/GANP/Nin1/mts3/eIF-3 p25 family-domain-containing protein [Phycomyces nitens]|nr:SAC3/GANP/Nin1/mts3/eIF-3 p25 family-domain-containing protein [Phycomyces nitens]